MLSASSNEVRAAGSEVTLAGGGKTYGGVFVGGWDTAQPSVINDNLNAYTNMLLKWSPASGWTAGQQSILPVDKATLNAIKAAIDRFKPGGETPLWPGCEFQFVYVGHGDGLSLYFADGPDPDSLDDQLNIETLAEWLSGFPKSVTIAVIFNSCCSNGYAEELVKAGVKDSNGKPLNASHLGIAWSAICRTNYLSYSWTWWWPFTASFMEKLTDGVEDGMDKHGVAVMKDIIKNYVVPTVKEQNTGDNDGDAKIDEDGAILRAESPNVIDYDDDGDGEIDEDPAPQEGGYIGPEGGVGGIVIPVDKFGLLVPYIGLTSTMLVATVTTAVYVKRVKRRKEKQ